MRRTRGKIIKGYLITGVALALLFGVVLLKARA